MTILRRLLRLKYSRSPQLGRANVQEDCAEMKLPSPPVMSYALSLNPSSPNYPAVQATSKFRLENRFSIELAAQLDLVIPQSWPSRWVSR
jgi:hypothetical protein